jgi:L-alanine-DL-glutamate epimerase-like enolase superfamily enzyme
MKIRELKVTLLEIPFKTSFKHATADRAKMASVWVEAHENNGELIGYGEGCPRNYVTGENLPSALEWIKRYQTSICKEITSLESLKDWVATQKHEIDGNPAAWCAVELALLDLLGKSEGRSLEALLSLPTFSSTFQYSAVLGDNDLAGFSKQVAKYVGVGFRDFKIKLSGDFENDMGKTACLNGMGMPVRIRGDANNLWRDSSEVIAYLNRLGQPFWALEEPLAARDFSGLTKISEHIGIKIILDESFTRARDFDAIKDAPDFWILNLRVSKLGGLIRSLDFARQARAFGLQLIIGAHVGETSVLSRAGLTLASAAGDARVAMEGAFGTHLLERDVSDPALMFGQSGMLCPEDWHFNNALGNGLAITNQHSTKIET